MMVGRRVVPKVDVKVEQTAVSMAEMMVVTTVETMVGLKAVLLVHLLVDQTAVT